MLLSASIWILLSEGGSKVFRNVGTLLLHSTTLGPERQISSTNNMWLSYQVFVGTVSRIEGSSENLWHLNGAVFLPDSAGLLYCTGTVFDVNGARYLRWHNIRL